MVNCHCFSVSLDALLHDFVPNKSSERLVCSLLGNIFEWDVDRVWTKRAYGVFQRPPVSDEACLVPSVVKPFSLHPLPCVRPNHGWHRYRFWRTRVNTDRTVSCSIILHPCPSVTAKPHQCTSVVKILSSLAIGHVEMSFE